MRILHVTQMVQGGVASHLSEILPHQMEEFGEDNVRVLIAKDQIDHIPELPENNRVVFANSDRSAKGLLGLASALRAAVREFRPDVLHAHSTFAGAVARTALPTRSNRPRLVYCAHGWSFNMQVSPAKKLAFSVIERALSSRTDAILCISEFERRTALSRGLPTAKLHTVYNGIAETDRPSGDDLEGKQALNLLFVGRFDRQKGVDTLLEAMALLKDKPVHLDMIGSQVLGERFSLPTGMPNVTYHGWQPRERIPAFLAQADAVIVPSRWEGFGLVVIEAMRQSKAVIASSVDAIPELVEDGVNGHLVPPDSPKALADRLSRLARPELNRMGAAGRERFLAHFTSKEMNRKIISHYLPTGDHAR